jgi:hypothetical protein
MNVDPSVDVRKRWFALTPQQRRNVWRRLSSHRAKIPRSVWLLAMQETITLELTAGRPDPDPCRSPVQPAIGPMIQDSYHAVCENAPRIRP